MDITTFVTRSVLILVVLSVGCTTFRARPHVPAPHTGSEQQTQAQTAGLKPRHEGRPRDEGKGKPRPDRPGDALLWRNKSLTDENGRIDPDGLARAKAHVDAMRAVQRPLDAGVTPASWTSLGPGNYGGRIRSWLIDPVDPNRMFIGSVSGGIWKTTNGGTSWSPVNDFMANLAVASMVWSADQNTMYAGTGEGFFNFHNARGAGIFKSIDRGVTWTQLPSTANANFHYVNRMAVSPNGNVLLAATTSGIFRSVDGGTNFTLATLVGGGAMNVGNGLTDIDFHPTDSQRAIASGFHGQVYFSTDGGMTWTAATGLPANGIPVALRAEVTYARSSPQTVYASVDANFGMLYVSTNGGQSFTLRYDGGVTGNQRVLGFQGWYDNVLWVKPTDLNFIIWAGVDSYRSTDGGVTFNRISTFVDGTSAHADFHAIVEHPQFNDTTNRIVFFGTDGGPYRAADINTVGTPCEIRFFGCGTGWSHLNSHLAITQFYGAAGHAATGRIAGGTQDNFSLHFDPGRPNPANEWWFLAGGDGGYAAHDPIDPQISYGEYIGARVHRNTTGGRNGSFFIHCYDAASNTSGHPNALVDAGTPDSEFIAPFILDPNNPNRLLVGTTRLWVTDDAKTSVGDDGNCATGPAWRVIKPSLGATPQDYVSAIAVVPGNSNRIYAGHNSGQLYMSGNSTPSGPTWMALDDNAGSNPLPNRRVTRITIDPADATGQTVYVSLGGFSPDNVWKSVDGGFGWTDITGANPLAGLPDVPVRDIEPHPTMPGWLYAATEIGLFASEDGGVTWGLPPDGPSNVPVDELFFLGTRLIAVTYGRGLFSSNTVPNQAPTITPIGDQTIFANRSKQVSFTIADAETNPSQLTLFANPTYATMTFAGSGANRSVTITPTSLLPDRLTIYVGDGTNVTTVAFNMTVVVAQPPTISTIAAQTTVIGAPITIPFTIADPDSPLDQMRIAHNVTNDVVLPLSNVVISGSGANRQVTVTPAVAGTTSVMLLVTDTEDLTATRSFTLTVPNPLPPTISTIPNQTGSVGVPIVVPFTIGDPDTPLASLTVQASSNNPTVVPQSNIVLSGTGATRQIQVTPAANGVSPIVVTVTDPQLRFAQTTFDVAVGGGPTLSAILDQTISVNSQASIPFTIGDASGPIEQLVVTATSSNTAILPGDRISMSGNVANRQLLLAPAIEGVTTVTVTVRNQIGLSTSRTFQLTAGGRPTFNPATVNGNQLTLTWSQPPGAGVFQSYVIVVSLIAGGPQFVQLPTGNLATQFGPLAAPNGVFYATVRTTGPFGSGTPSNEIAIVIGPPPPPSAPRNLAASVSGSTFTMTWDEPLTSSLAPVGTYVIEAGSTAGGSDLANFASGPARTFTTPPVPNGRYFMRVRARNASGTSEASNEVIVNVGPPPAGAPTNLVGNAVNRTVTLTWNAPATGGPVTGYQIRAGSGSGLSNLAQLTVPSTQTSFSVSGVPPGTYFIRIASVDAFGPGAVSNEITLVVQ